MTIELTEEEFRKKAAEFIQNCEMSISELAKVGKISRNTVTSIKDNKKTVKINSIKKLLSAVNCSLQVLPGPARNLLNELTSETIEIKSTEKTLSSRFALALGKMNTKQFEEFKERQGLLREVFSDTYINTEEAITILAETLTAERT